jgi:parvulin-like peptidyl-prolyl isomerase
MKLFQGGRQVIAAAALLLSLLQASSCDRPPSTRGEDGEVLARVDGVSVTVDEFKAALARGVKKNPRVYSGDRKRERLLRHMVDEEVLFAQALEEGYDKSPGVAREIRRMVVSEYLKKNLVPLLDKATVTDEEIAKHYQENLERYRTHELARAAVISFRIPAGADEAGRGTLREKARAVLEEARELPADVPGFGELAARHSDDSKTRAAGGDIGWIIRSPKGSGLDLDLRAAIVQLQKPGQLSSVIETETALYFAKLTELRPARQRPLSEVRSSAKTLLLQLARDVVEDKFYQELRADRKITIDLELLKGLEDQPASEQGD